MQIFISIMMAICLSLFADAKGVLAGTVISNQVKASYTIKGQPKETLSNKDTFVVDKIVDIDISWQDNAPVVVEAGDQDRILMFALTNLGNSEENITIAYEHNTSSDFAPIDAAICLDDDNNSRFEPSHDPLVHRVWLSPDTNVTLFIVGDIPLDLNASDKSYDAIVAQIDINASSGADDPRRMDTVVRKAKDIDTGIYIVRDYWLMTRKYTQIHSDDNLTHVGTHVTYHIDLWIEGDKAHKSIEHIVVEDNIPTGARYIPNSLKLNDVLLSDKADDDAGVYDGNTTKVYIKSLNENEESNITFDIIIL